MRRCLATLVVLLPLLAAAQTAPATDARPRLGLVLSGGGARGIAHVGVLKVLERERIPVDMIAGTSMGAIIGGLYASGMSAAQLERELLPLAWDRVFASRVERQQLSQRRKEEDFEFSAVMELGMRDGEFRAPQSTLSSRGLEILLRRYTLPVREQHDFDRLPTPFRAITTDMESGQQLVLGQGDLALALRSSMSVPGLFAPVEWQGRILGDGGLVNNLPVDVARSLGAQRLIAVNVGTPLAGRETLSSLVGVTAQMINILTEQNVQRSLASLWDDDVLITPELGRLSSADFDKSRELIQQGERAAEAMVEKLRPLALSPEAYAAWRAARIPADPQRDGATRLAAVSFEGSTLTHPERLANQLESRPGQAFDPARAERDARLLTSSGDYERVDYHLERRAAGDTLVFAMEDKPWGPNYFRIGLDLSTDFAGESSFSLRISHNRHWLTSTGTEWRNQLSLGQTSRLYSELYQPLSFRIGHSNDWFLSGWGELERRSIPLYQDNDERRGMAARLSRSGATLGIDLGQPWGQWGEVRLGVFQQAWRLSPQVLSIEAPSGIFGRTWHESALRLKAVVDQLDFANFPQRGYRVVAEAVVGRQTDPSERKVHARRYELQATGVHSWGTHTLNAHLRLFDAKQPEDSAQGPYSLGGFQQLSGYQPGQLSGNTLVFARMGYYQRLKETPVLTRGLFIGGSLEIGNAWDNRRDVRGSDLRHAMSVFVGADTGLGPLYLALGHAPRGGSAIYLFIGRP
ncbi:patatin [Roseateles sp. DAIF2]|uniref:patatin-like phospholipase family protein n=1 Tax=Roseateles sp. DAIF2 TaxID=2714952 RepID=UPI0018A2C0B5|nr:patatin-like phospholipase family protein [Roseateles sp. DAIF2]QPF75504.1 patatin [Roseateles sp. DAIF2]